MAHIHDYVFTEGTVASASPVADMPEHAANDLLIVFVNSDLVTVNAAGGTWTSLDNQVVTNGHSWRIEYKIAASSSETYSTTLSASDEYTITVVAVRNVNTTTPIHVNAKRTTDDSTIPFVGVGVTTTNNNCLVFQFLSTDGGLGPTCEPPWTNLVNGDASTCSGGLAYMVKKVAGVVATPNWRGTVNDNTFAAIVAINDNGSVTTLQGYIQQDTINGKLLEHGYWITAGGANSWGNVYQTSLSLATIGSKTTLFDAAALAADQGLNPYWPVVSCTPAASTNGTTVGGPQMNFGVATDLRSGIVLFNYFFVDSRDYVDLSTATDSGKVGILFVERDATTYRAWSVGAKNTITTKPDGYNIVGIQVDQSTDTTFAVSGTVDHALVDSILTLAQGRYGAVSFRWGNLCIVFEHVLAGGTSGTPLTFEDFDFILNHSIGQQRVMLREGSAATLLAPLKIGGTDPIHVLVNLRTFQFRRQADELDYLDWHVDANKVGFEFDGQASDTIKFTNCVFVSDTSYYWRFNAGHSASATIDFSGSVVINAQVTLVAASDLDNVTFIDCSSFTLGGAVITNSTFDNTTVTAASPADAANISASSFASGGTGHALIVTGTAADFTLTGVTFTGYAVSNGSTGNEAVYINIASGSLTLTVNGGSTLSVRTAGAVVTLIVNPVTLAVNVKNTVGSNIQNARVLLRAADGTGPFPFNVTVTITNSGTTATVTHTAHGMLTGDKAQIKGASLTANNGVWAITKINDNSYSYEMLSSPGSNPTGTIKATFAALYGLTDVDGNISTLRVYSAAQPVTGWVRKSTSTPFFKEALLGGSVSATLGYSANVQLVADE